MHPDHSLLPILDTASPQLVQPLLLLDYLPSFSNKHFLGKMTY